MRARWATRVAALVVAASLAPASPAWATKPAKSAAADTPRLVKLRKLVDGTATTVDQLVLDVAAAHGDEERLQRIGVRFQLFMQRTEVAMEALESRMTDPEREVAQTYGQTQLETRVAKMGAALREIQAASGRTSPDDPETPEEQSLGSDALRKEFGALAEKFQALAVEARAAGTDEHKRDVVRQKLAVLVGQQGDLLVRTRSDRGVARPRVLMAQANLRLEPLAMRVDRLLRLGGLPPCPTFEAAKKDVTQLAATLAQLVAELALVADEPALAAVEARWETAQATLETIEAIKTLTIDEATELRSVLDESVVPTVAAWKERQTVLVQKLRKQP